MPTPPTYAGFNLDNLRQLTATGWGLGVALTVACLAIAPPTEAVGDAGWAVAAAMEVALGLVVLHVLRPARASFDAMLFLAGTAVVKVAVLQWLAGGWESPVDQLLLLVILMVCAGHPLRRAVPFAGCVMAAALLPVAYDDHHDALPETLVQLTTWAVMAAFTLTIMARVRAQRLQERGLARSDALTQLANRRAFEEAVDATAQDYGVISLAIGDLNDFKEVNDRFGHLAGDRCLADVGAALADHARLGDEVFRWGGDEFAVLLRGTCASEVAVVCERLERAVAETVRRPDGLPVCITFGWATTEGEAHVRELVVAADEALFARKRARAAALGSGDAMALGADRLVGA